MPRHWYVALETLARLCMAVVGTLLLFVLRPRVGRFVARTPGRAIQIVVAVLLAIGASDLALHHVHLGPAEWLLPDEEPRRQADPQLGWTWVPEHTGSMTCRCDEFRKLDWRQQMG